MKDFINIISYLIYMAYEVCLVVMIFFGMFWLPLSNKALVTLIFIILFGVLWFQLRLLATYF